MACVWLPLVAAAQQPVWDVAQLSVAPKTFSSQEIRSADPRIQALFFESVPYRGEPTRVFAWLGAPDAAPGTRVPGIVLVHGGGGTAFQSWVKLWLDRGYAAIAMDTCGALPEPDVRRPTPRPRHAHSGPPGWGGFDQMDEKPEDQWTYHAVAAVVLAHSLLRSQPNVDPARVGLTGISWGGYLTCILAGVDDRFAFAAPVYGCGFYLDSNFRNRVIAAGADQGRHWMAWWDPSTYLPQAKMPMLWINGTNDFAYWLPAWQQSYRLIPMDHRTLCLRLRMPHGQGPGESPREIAVFADSIVNGGDPLPAIVSQRLDKGRVKVEVQSPRPITRAELNCTSDTSSPWPEREWKTVPAKVDGNQITADLPKGAKLFFVNVIDDRDCVVSTEHAEVTGAAAPDATKKKRDAEP